MRKILLFGNSGSGKSTLARELRISANLAHLDLDELAWIESNPPQRAEIADSLSAINEFVQKNEGWVIEGCYSDLLELVTAEANEMIYLNLPIEECVKNALNRPWEPDKYASKEAQDENLAMLLSWIEDYEKRTDVFSRYSHENLYNGFAGKKIMYRSNARDT